MAARPGHRPVVSCGAARVMIKLGMSLERETVQPDTGRRVRVYAMDL
jgi:hypothetical protein